MIISRRRRGEQGFTLIEVLISLGLTALVATVMLQATIQITRILRQTSTGARATGNQAAVRVEQSLRADAQTAQAVYLPASDANGQANTGTDVAFLTQGDEGNSYAWGYHYDAASQALQRYTIARNGPVELTTVASHLTAFSAEALPASTLVGQANPYAPALANIGPSTMHPITDRTMRLPAGTIRGGNGIVQLTIAAEKAQRIVHLVAGTMPTGFSIVAAPTYHVVLWRRNTTTRSFLGLIQNTRAQIYARVSVRYTPDGPAVPWCDYHVGTFDGNPDNFWRSAAPNANAWNPAQEDPKRLFQACITRADGTPIPMPTAPPLRSGIRMTGTR